MQQHARFIARTGTPSKQPSRSTAPTAHDLGVELTVLPTTVLTSQRLGTIITESMTTIEPHSPRRHRPRGTPDVQVRPQ